MADALLRRLEGRRAFLAATGHESRVERELEAPFVRHGRLFVVEGPARVARFAANVWHDVHEVDFESISQAARALRSLGRSWWPLETTPGLHRRAALIQERLPHVSAKPLRFPQPAPTTPLGSYTLLTPNRMLASAHASSPFPNGECRFEEDRSGPPNRAYLKLWEALSLLGRFPGPGSRCLDAGAAPGGWTWVLSKLGASVLAVDRSPLAGDIARSPGVEFRTGSGFSFQPADERFDWILSDMACYPRRLWSWTERWLESGAVRNLVLTVKLQGEGDDETLTKFEGVADGRLLHLHHNKHELTFLWPFHSANERAGSD